MKTLESFEFGTQVGRSSYDWDNILDGEIHALTPGKDFECKPQTMKQRARQVAAKLGKKVRTGLTKDGDIVIQAYEMTKEEKAFAEAAAKNKKTKAKSEESEVADDAAETAEEQPKRRRRA